MRGAKPALGLACSLDPRASGQDSLHQPPIPTQGPLPGHQLLSLPPTQVKVWGTTRHIHFTSFPCGVAHPTLYLTPSKYLDLSKRDDTVNLTTYQSDLSFQPTQQWVIGMWILQSVWARDECVCEQVERILDLPCQLKSSSQLTSLLTRLADVYSRNCRKCLDRPNNKWPAVTPNGILPALQN